LAEPIALSDDFLRQLMNVGEVDLLVAVPTHDDAKLIGQVVQAVHVGLVKYFPRDRAVLVNPDANSRDGSGQEALQAAAASLPAEAGLYSLRTFHAVTATYDGASALSALPLVIAAADLLQAKACAVIQPSPHVTPDWIRRLLHPVYRENFAFVAPLYRRHKFDGLLIKVLLYPMVRAMYGKRIREPFSTDFGFSAQLGAEAHARSDARPAEPADAGDELWLSTSALASGYPVCETFLGPKGQAEQTSDLVPAMRQTAGTLFASLNATVERWQTIQGSEPVPVIGGEAEITSEVLRVNRKRMYTMFQSGVTDLQAVLKTILAPNTLADLTSCAGRGEEEFCFPDELWARVIYEFTASYHRAVITRDHIIQALVPLYRGKVYEFLSQNRLATGEEIEARLEALCVAFERLKPYLLQLWNSQEGASYEGNDPPRAGPDVGRADAGVRAPGPQTDRDADRDRSGMAHRLRHPGSGARHPAHQQV
jgi:glucosylglycerate synthase